MKYLKEFETTAEYEAYSADTENFILPNISVCNDNIYKVYYNTFEKPALIVKYNVEDSPLISPTRLYFYSDGSMSPIENYGVDIFTKAVIDGTEVPVESLDAEEGTYQLSIGEHTVRYTLADQTTLEGPIFAGCYNVAEAIIPNGVTSIEKKCFTVSSTIMCAGPFISSGIESVTIPDSVTNIGENTFQGCSSLTSVTVNATTPPTLGEGAFSNNASGRKIYVPAASVDAYKAAEGWSTYAEDIEAIQ